MNEELLAAKLSQLGFVDLEALKRLKNNEMSEFARTAIKGEEIAFWEELANFNIIIDDVITKKIKDLETDNYFVK